MCKLSIVVPVYFDSSALWNCYNDLNKNVFCKISDYELIFVDDGSEDDSFEVCKQIAVIDKNVKVIKLSRNFGANAACYAGIAASTGDCCTVKSSDCQEPPSLILDMYESWKSGNRVVLAVRRSRNDGFVNDLFSSMYYRMVRRLINPKMPKGGFDCFLLDNKVVEALKLFDELNSSIVLQVLWSGFRTSSVYYNRLPRQTGRSRWTLGKKLKLVIDALISFSTAPIRFIQLIGALFAIGSSIWGIILVVLNIFGTVEVEGWTSLMVVVLFSSGLILLTLGILGECTWRILDSTKKRPVYLIEDEFCSAHYESKVKKE